MKIHVATDDCKTFYCSPDISHALSGKLTGKVYVVQFHEKPKYTFYVEADNADLAHARAILVIRDGKPSRLRQTGATVQAVT